MYLSFYRIIGQEFNMINENDMLAVLIRSK